MLVVYEWSGKQVASYPFVFNPENIEIIAKHFISQYGPINKIQIDHSKQIAIVDYKFFLLKIYNE